jgi:hypothetical protein
MAWNLARSSLGVSRYLFFVFVHSFLRQKKPPKKALVLQKNYKNKLVKAVVPADALQDLDLAADKPDALRVHLLNGRVEGIRRAPHARGMLLLAQQGDL